MAMRKLDFREPNSVKAEVSLSAPVRSTQATESQDAVSPLAEYLRAFRRHWWKMAAFIIAVVALALIGSRFIPRVYDATATLEVDRRALAGIMAQNPDQSFSTADLDQFLATQMEIIQSDAVLRPVAERFKLLEKEGQLSGLERAQVTEVYAAPVTLKGLTLSRPANTSLLQITYRSHEPALSAEVANAVANSHLEHARRMRTQISAGVTGFMEKQLDELRDRMEQSAAALARFERELNIVGPEDKSSVISSRLLQLNTEYTNAQSDRVKKQAANDTIRRGSVAAAQISGHEETLNEVKERLNQAQQRFAETKSIYGANHPEYREAENELRELTRQYDAARREIVQQSETEYQQALNRERMLANEISRTRSEFDRLNQNLFAYQQVRREAENDRKLYDDVARRIHETNINAGFEGGAVRIADMARPPVEPSGPKPLLNAVLALLVSTVLSVGAVILSTTLDTSFHTFEDAGSALPVNMISALPYVRGTDRGRMDAFEESARALRNTIFAMRGSEAGVKSILLTSAEPGEGKTTVAAQLAAVLAEFGRRTLLIHADFHGPDPQRESGDKPGLSNILLQDISWRDAVVKHDSLPDLSILSLGSLRRRASELDWSGFTVLLQEVGADYDHIVVDAPVVGAAESIQIMTTVDTVVLVTRAEVTSRQAVLSALASLERSRANLLGVVLNGVTGRVTAA